MCVCMFVKIIDRGGFWKRSLRAGKLDIAYEGMKNYLLGSTRAT